MKPNKSTRNHLQNASQEDTEWPSSAFVTEALPCSHRPRVLNSDYSTLLPDPSGAPGDGGGASREAQSHTSFTEGFQASHVPTLCLSGHCWETMGWSSQPEDYKS